MYLNPTFKVLNYLILLVIFYTGQLGTAPSNRTNEFPFSNSSIPIFSHLKPASKVTKQSLPSTNSFFGSAPVLEQIIFTPTSSLNIGGSQGATATLLRNGKVLVVGGENNPTGSELYDPITGIWSSTGSLNANRRYHNATLLNDGKVLVVGGEGSRTSAEIYDPISSTWSTTGSMNVEHSLNFTITLLDNGEVLAAGGYGIDGETVNSELYDPISGTWNTTSSMTRFRVDHTATLLQDGRVLIAGGHGVADSFNIAEIYDPSTGLWGDTGSMNEVRYQGNTATLLNDGKVLVSGNAWYSESSELYDPVLGTWSFTSNMNIGRREHNATLLNNGMVLVTGGSSGGSKITASTELYNPANGSWISTNNMNIARHRHTVTLLENGVVLIAGGLSNNGFDLANAELATLVPANYFTGKLTLPSRWENNTTINVQFSGTTSEAAIDAGALSNDNISWGEWISASSNEIITTTWSVSDGDANKPIYLRLRDVNGQITTVVRGANSNSVTFLSEGQVFSGGPSTLSVKFGENVLGNGSAHSATNLTNYMLVMPGTNGNFDTIVTSLAVCEPAHTPNGDDVNIAISSISYDATTYIATLTINPSFAPLADGQYRLYVCGAASIWNLTGNPINGGGNMAINFKVSTPANVIDKNILPNTGFPPNMITSLPNQPANSFYKKMASIWLEIPSQNVMANIVGVPEINNNWDVSWLGNDVGWLQGTAFPTWAGNSALTAHVYDANGQPGLFNGLGALKWGDEVIVHAYGQDYVYKVRTVEKYVGPDDASSVYRHEEYPWLTLITCKGYDQESDSYRWRVVVRAVQTKIY